MKQVTQLAVLREHLHISYSQIRSYTICPKKYEYSYVLNTEPSHRPVALVLGGTVHKALAAFYSHVKAQGEAMPPESVCDAYRDFWEAEMNKEIPVLFGEGTESGQVLDQGIGLLKAFHEQVDTPEVVAVEQPFSVDIADPVTGEVLDIQLIGAFDLVTKENDRLVIVEHKTAARRYSQDQLAWDLQPTAYLHAAHELGMEDIGLRYQLLLKTKTPAVEICEIERTPAHVREMLETVSSVLNGIEAGIFFRQRGWACGDCQYAYACGSGS